MTLTYLRRYFFSNANWFALLISVFYSFKAMGQPLLKDTSLAGENCIISWEQIAQSVKPNHRGVLLFCPISTTNRKEDYQKKINELINDPEFKLTSNISIITIYYGEGSKNTLKNPRMIKSKSDTNMFQIRGFECIMYNFDTSHINRAIAISNGGLTSEVLLGENLYCINSKACYPTLVARIPSLKNFLIESASPKYTTEEKLNSLKSEFVLLQQEVLELKQSQKELELKLSQACNTKEQDLNSKVLNEDSGKSTKEKKVKVQEKGKLVSEDK